MAERTVKVSLSAQVAAYKRGMEEAADATRKVGSEGEKLAQIENSLNTVGAASLAFGAALAVGVGVAISRFADFDAAMSNVQAATLESSENMAALREAALEAGASTVFSATESANAIEELSKAGLSTADILSGALAGSLDLAAAGGLGVARAAEISATALQQFNLDGDQASHVADLLAAGAGKAMGSVDDLANALKFVGPVAASMGVSLEETTGTLALFAQQGIIGEQAGTSLRGVLASLTSPSAQARDEIERLGLSLYDSQGNFLGLQNAAGELAGAYRGMDDASRNASLGIIFGRETITAATALYQAGAEGVAEWTANVDDSGYAAEVARIRLDNLKGDLEALGGAFDSALIETGSAANDVLRTMVQALTGLIDVYAALPGPVQGTALAIGGVAAAVALAGGAAALAVPKFLELRNAAAVLGLSMGRMALLAGGAGLALSGLVAIIGLVVSAQVEAQQRAENYASTLEEGTNRITDSTRDMAKEALAAKNSFLWMEQDSAYDAAEKLGISLDLVTEAALGNKDAMKELQEQIDAGADGTLAYANSARDILDAVEAQSGALSSATEMQKQKAEADREAAEASGDAAIATQENEVALEALTGQAEDATTGVEDLADAIRNFGSAQFDVRDATRQFEEAVDALSESVVANGNSLDVGTEAGRANEAALDSIAQSALDLAGSLYTTTGSQDQAAGAIRRGRDALIEALAQFGITGQAAEDYADELGLIPENINTYVSASTADAERTIENFKLRYGTIRGTIVYRATTEGPRGDGTAGGFAEGGYIPGPPSNRDNVIAAMATGEFVTRTSEAQKPVNRRWLEYMNSGGQMPPFRGYAGGGFVQPQYMSTPNITVSAPAPGGLQPGDRLQLVLEDGTTLSGYVRQQASAVTGQALRDQRVQGEMGSRR